MRRKNESDLPEKSFLESCRSAVRISCDSVCGAVCCSVCDRDALCYAGICKVLRGSGDTVPSMQELMESYMQALEPAFEAVARHQVEIAALSCAGDDHPDRDIVCP